MSRLPNVSGEFRIATDPELRFTPSGAAVCQLSIVTSESRKNESTGDWEDGDRSPFISVSVWKQAAEAAAEELEKGQRVLVSGQLYERKYQRQDGTEGSSIELKWATVAAVPGGKSKASKGRAGTGYQHGGQTQGNGQPDPWATPAATGGQDPWAPPAPGASSEDPPF